MQKILVILFVCILVVNHVIAKENNDSIQWQRGGDYSINFSQATFSNWAGGGLNAISGVTQLNVFANYTKEGTAWENKFQMGYGLTSQEGMDAQKSEDIFDFQSKFGLKANKTWNYSVLFNFKSQFTDGFVDTVKISSLFAPAYVTLSIGMDYKPSNKFAVMISPLAGKATIVVDESLISSYGVDEGKIARMEIGAQLATSFNAEVLKNVNLSSDLKLFSNYIVNPQNVDIDWQININMKINDFLSAKITTRMVYDDNIKTRNKDNGHLAPQLQFKELLGIGFNLKF